MLCGILIIVILCGGECRFSYEVWLSLVERYVRDVEAAGSNPVTSTSASVHKGIEHSEYRSSFLAAPIFCA